MDLQRKFFAMFLQIKKQLLNIKDSINDLSNKLISAKLIIRTATTTTNLSYNGFSRCLTNLSKSCIDILESDNFQWFLKEKRNEMQWMMDDDTCRRAKISFKFSRNCWKTRWLRWMNVSKRIFDWRKYFSRTMRRVKMMERIERMMIRDNVWSFADIRVDCEWI